jgi:hypothetical protein
MTRHSRPMTPNCVNWCSTRTMSTTTHTALHNQYRSAQPRSSIVIVGKSDVLRGCTVGCLFNTGRRAADYSPAGFGRTPAVVGAPGLAGIIDRGAQSNPWRELSGATVIFQFNGHGHGHGCSRLPGATRRVPVGLLLRGLLRASSQHQARERTQCTAGTATVPLLPTAARFRTHHKRLTKTQRYGDEFNMGVVKTGLMSGRFRQAVKIRRARQRRCGEATGRGSSRRPRSSERRATPLRTAPTRRANRRASRASRN